MLRYAITSRALLPGDESEKQTELLCHARKWAAQGVEFIQLREKDLDAESLAALARRILRVIAEENSHTRLLINSLTDIAVATHAHGVHLTGAAGEMAPHQVRRLYASANLPEPVITISCHSLEDIHRAKRDNVSAILFAPVFEKTIAGKTIVAGVGLSQLQAACSIAAPIPVYALGGVTLANADACMEAGAAGIAGIRLFHRS